MSEPNTPLDKPKVPIKYGFLKKIDGTKGMFMLYPDVFAACVSVRDEVDDSNQINPKAIKYTPEMILNLEQAQVRDEDQNGQPCFTVVAGFASVSVIADSTKQRDEWVNEIRKAIDSLDKRPEDGPFLEKPQENELFESVTDFFTKNPKALLQKMYQKHKRGKSFSESSENLEIKDVIVKKGYLKKTGGKMMASKLKWFVLRRKSLAYYETENCENKSSQGYIELNSTVKLYDSQKHTDGFRVSFHDGTWYLQADSISEKLDWVNAIRKCIIHGSEESTSSPSSTNLTIKNVALHESKKKLSFGDEKLDEIQSEEERASSNSAEGYSEKARLIESSPSKISHECQGVSSSEDETLTRSASLAVFPADREELFDISDNEEIDWAEAKSANDWALVEGWLQEFANTVKSGNETLKYDMKKALNRLKKGGSKPFIVLGNDLRKFNRKLTGQKKKSSISESSEIEMKKMDPSVVETPESEVVPAVHLPISCGCEQHYENKFIDQIVDIPCQQLFNFIYESDSSFNKNFAAKRGVKDSKEEIIETMTIQQRSCWKKRKFSYYHLVNNPIAKSPFALCIETQSVLVYEEDRRYVLEVESVSPEVPYGDYFTAVARYCITFETPSSSKIACHVQLVWKKSSPLKGFVAKLALGALKDHMKEFLNILLKSSGSVRITTPTKVERGSTEIFTTRQDSQSQNETEVEKKDEMDVKTYGLLSLGVITSLLLLICILPNMFGTVSESSDRIALALRCGVFSCTPILTSFFWSNRDSSEVNNFFKLTNIFILNLVGLSTYHQMKNSMNMIALFTVYHFVGCIAFFVFFLVYDVKGVKNPGYLVSILTISITLLFILFLSFSS